MKHRILALLLCAVMALSLTGCKSGQSDPTDQDILTYAAGMSGSDTVVTINGEKVPADFYLYWLSLNCTQFDTNYGGLLNIADYATSLKANSLSMTTYYTLLKQKCVEYGCPLTDAQLEERAAKLAEDPDTLAESKLMFGLSDATTEEIYSLSYYYDNLLNTLVPTPTDAELNNYVYQAKHILLATVDLNGQPTLQEDGTHGYPKLDEEAIARKKALAEDIIAQLAASDDPHALFDELMHEHSEDGRDADGNLAAPDGYVATHGEMVPEFEAGALALKPGEISGIVESSYGYHIILRGEVEDLDEYAIRWRQSQMDTLTNQWIMDAKVEPAESLTKLDAADFFSRFVDWQAAKALELHGGEDHTGHDHD